MPIRRVTNTDGLTEKVYNQILGEMEHGEDLSDEFSQGFFIGFFKGQCGRGDWNVDIDFLRWVLKKQFEKGGFYDDGSMPRFGQAVSWYHAAQERGFY